MGARLEGRGVYVSNGDVRDRHARTSTSEDTMTTPKTKKSSKSLPVPSSAALVSEAVRRYYAALRAEARLHFGIELE